MVGPHDRICSCSATARSASFMIEAMHAGEVPVSLAISEWLPTAPYRSRRSKWIASATRRVSLCTDWGGAACAATGASSSFFRPSRTRWNRILVSIASGLLIECVCESVLTESEGDRLAVVGDALDQ